MDVFRTDRIRNVVLLGHGGAGKRNWMKMAPIQIKMKWPSTFMSMAMYPPI